MSCENPFGETIYASSRAQAIADGVLVDLSENDAIRQHWRHPFACTSAVWAVINEALQCSTQDLSGICHDLSVMAKRIIRTGAHERNESAVRFEVIIRGRTHTFKLHVGPGDRAEPVMTLMLPYED